MGLSSVFCVAVVGIALVLGDTNIPAGAVEFEGDVYCTFEEGSGGFVIMQQKYGHVSFVQNYQRYLYGFGSAHLGDFWFGLIKTKALTDHGYNKLTVWMQDCNNILKKVIYNWFSLGPFSTHFKLNIHSFDHLNSNLPDDFSFNNGMPFATYDKPDINHCAIHQRGGWWYNRCTKTLPTGRYYQNCWYTPQRGFYDGIYYEAWRGYSYSLKYIRMDLSKH
ncbi:ANGL6-like protein [Mya arenaria]|uniref:ANGL6-like protein n=1 Tax=Mya arenaria TaxID=6604 RepID=A0ABY7FVW1_MYAAR|nr:ANGL6-like protein [Mya arenaria]